MFNGHKYFPINNKTDNFLIEKKVKKSWHYLDFRSNSEQDPDPDPLFHETDPQHCQRV